MRYLGLDIGTKNIGVSMSDKTNLIASIYKTIRIEENDYDKLITEVLNIAKEFNITDIVIGLPKHMNNDIGDKALFCIDFGEKLKKYDYNIHMQDERRTSIEANNFLISSNVRRDKRKKVVDNIAAVIILQTFLDKENRRI